MPSCSIGFCVARTRNGSGSGVVVSPTVTCRSCIASRSADCTLAGARLISSARTRFANTGPRRATNSCVFGLKTSVPMRSAGRRSGVNWMREKDASRPRARVLTASVLARPGTPSRSRWPSARRPIVSRSTRAPWPTITLRISVRRAPTRSDFSRILSVRAAGSRPGAAVVNVVVVVILSLRRLHFDAESASENGRKSSTASGMPGPSGADSRPFGAPGRITRRRGLMLEAMAFSVSAGSACLAFAVLLLAAPVVGSREKEASDPDPDARSHGDADSDAVSPGGRRRACATSRARTSSCRKSARRDASSTSMRRPRSRRRRRREPASGSSTRTVPTAPSRGRSCRGRRKGKAGSL